MQCTHNYLVLEMEKTENKIKIKSRYYGILFLIFSVWMLVILGFYYLTFQVFMERGLTASVILMLVISTLLTYETHKLMIPQVWYRLVRYIFA